MIATKAHGNCSKTGCGRYSEAVGADKLDARYLLSHNHGHEYGHAFAGEVTYSDHDTKEKR